MPALHTGARNYRLDTMEAYQRGVRASIRMMQERLGDPLTVDDLADSAFMSRYHFTRVFSKVTGVSPGRFLAAVRMQQAKRLLLQTDRCVTEVSLDVGYNSLGTFTRVFSESVGFPPVRFRQLSRPLLRLTLDQVARFLSGVQSPSARPSLRGELVAVTPVALATAAMFPTRIPRSHPIECVCLKDSLRFGFHHSPPRRGRIFAAGLLPEATIEDALLLAHERVQVAAVDISSAITGDSFSLELGPQRVTDPPVVVAFPLLVAELLVAHTLTKAGGTPPFQTTDLLIHRATEHFQRSEIA